MPAPVGVSQMVMVPEELLPMIYVSWEFETMQFCIPSWDTHQAALQQACRGETAEPAHVRRARGLLDFQKVCADAAADNAHPSADDICVATPRLASALMYAKATKGIAAPFLQRLGQEQVDDSDIVHAAGFLNAACPAGMPNLYIQVAAQAASEVRSWATGKSNTLPSQAARSRQSKAVQQTMQDAKQRHDEMQEYLEAFRDAIAQYQNWILHNIARDCPPSITTQWLQSACPKPHSEVSLNAAQLAWAAVKGYYDSFGNEEPAMAAQVDFLITMNRLSVFCYAAINSLHAAVDCLLRLKGLLQDSHGGLINVVSAKSQECQALPAANASRSRSAAAAAAHHQSAHRSDKIAEALLQEEGAEKATASGKKAKALKKRLSQKTVPSASSTNATASTKSNSGRLGQIL